MEVSRISKTAATVDKIIKVLRSLALAAAICVLIMIPLVLIFGEEMIKLTPEVYLGNVEMTLTGDPASYLDMGKLKACITIALAVAAVELAFVWYALKILREILSPMKEGRPFERGVSEKIRRLGWITLIGGAILEVANVIASKFELAAYDLTTIFSSNVEKVESVARINLWFVIAALILFFLAYIFHYGEQLQKESDETL